MPMLAYDYIHSRITLLSNPVVNLCYNIRDEMFPNFKQVEDTSDKIKLLQLLKRISGKFVFSSGCLTLGLIQMKSDNPIAGPFL